MSKTDRKRGIRYRFTTSVFAGVAVAVLALWQSTQHGHGDKIPTRALLGGDLTVGVLVAAVMFVTWSVIAVVRRNGRVAAERAREIERAERERLSRGRGGRRYRAGAR
jgi:hypothetical protein